MSTPSTISRRTILTAAAAAVVLIGGAGIWLGSMGGGGGGPAIGGSFQLVDTQGKPFTDRDLRGHYALIYFGYTFCPDVCPTTLNDVTAALDKMGSAGKDVQPVFISIDPKRDTPPVMKTYTAAFSPRLIGLTGTPAQIADVARKYHVYYAEHRTGTGPLDYSMDHSSVLYLMDPGGRFVAPLSAEESPTEMAADISKRLTS